MSTRVAGVLVAVIVAATVAAGIVALAGGTDDVPVATRGVPVGTVLTDPKRFLDASLVVTGRADVVTDRAMTISDGDRDLIVVAADPEHQNFELRLTEGRLVHATGRLELLDAEATVQRLPGPSLLPSQFQGFQRQPVLIASSVVDRGDEPAG